MRGQGIGQGDAFTDPLAYLGEHLLDRRLGGLVGKHGQGVEQRHTAAQQRGELAGEQGHVAGRHFTAQPGHPFAQRTALGDNFFVYVSGEDAQGAQFAARAAGTAATLETGAQIHVPLFITTGEKVKVDTRTGEYLSRA